MAWRKQSELPFVVRVAGLVVQPHPAAVALGLVHGDVRSAQQPLQVLAVLGGDRHPDAGTDLQRDPVDDEGAVQDVADAASDPQRGLGVRQVAQQHGELVASEPRDDVVRTHGLPQRRGDLHEQLIAHAVPEGVVDRLEPVQVEQQERCAARCAAPARSVVEQRTTCLGQQRAVAQPGERVGPCLSLAAEQAPTEERADPAERDQECASGAVQAPAARRELSGDSILRQEDLRDEPARAVL